MFTDKSILRDNTFDMLPQMCIVKKTNRNIFSSLSQYVVFLYGNKDIDFAKMVDGADLCDLEDRNKLAEIVIESSLPSDDQEIGQVIAFRFMHAYYGDTEMKNRANLAAMKLSRTETIGEYVLENKESYLNRATKMIKLKLYI